MEWALWGAFPLACVYDPEDTEHALKEIWAMDTGSGPSRWTATDPNGQSRRSARVRPVAALRNDKTRRARPHWRSNSHIAGAPTATVMLARARRLLTSQP